MEWYYQGRVVKELDELPNWEFLEGFVYKITNLETGKFYIGKKAIFHTTRKRISAREKKKTGTRSRIKVVTKESDWKKYWGSCKELIQDMRTYGPENFRREILETCCTKKYLSYAELSWQIKMDVLKNNSYNGNILGRFYHRDMENC